MNQNIKRVVVPLLAILGFLGLSAQSCEGQKVQPSGLILDISGPPLAQTLGCGNKLWYISVLNNDIANDPKLTPDQKAAKKQKVCVTEKVAQGYVVEGQYP